MTALRKRIQTSKNYFWLGVFGKKYIFRIKLKILILNVMLLAKTVFHLKGYTTEMLKTRRDTPQVLEIPQAFSNFY